MLYFIFIAVVVVIALYILGRSEFSFASRRQAGLKNSELIGVLLQLDDHYFAELLNLYKKQFGPGAARYAGSTFRKWESGEVRPNRRTFQRFYTSLPGAMSFDLKCEVVRKLRETYCLKDSLELAVTPDNWKETLLPLVDSMLEKSRTAQLPARLKERISWLSEGEAELANGIVAESAARETAQVMSLLEREFSNIDCLLDGMEGRGKVIHTLRFPTGTIELKITKPK